MRRPKLGTQAAALSGSAAHPFLLSGGFVLLRFAGTSATLDELWRPLVFSLALAGTLLVLLRLVIHDWHLAALLASIILMLACAFAPPAILLTAVVVWWASLRLVSNRNGRPPMLIRDIPSRLATALAVGLLVVGLASAGWAIWPRAPEHASLDVSTRHAARPSFYILLLDGYPRADTLRNAFGIDNSHFTDALEARGFIVADDARSNYNKTWLTVASLFDARYVHDRPEIASPPKGGVPQIRLMHEVIQNGAVLDLLREEGYEIVSVPSRISTSDVLDDAEVRKTDGLNAFEIQLIAHSLVGRMMPELAVDLFARDHRATVHEQLDLLGDIAEEEVEGPRLVITHVMSPHLPFALGQEPTYLYECFPNCDLWTTPLEGLPLTEAEFASRLDVELRTLNKAVTGVLDEVIAGDPAGFVLVMSDHGIRHHIDTPEEHFRTLFAARTPGYADMFPADITPVNVFPHIMNRVFGSDLAYLPYEAWASDWEEPLLLERLFTSAGPGSQ